MQEKYYYEQEKSYLNIKDLFCYLIRKLHLMLLSMVLFGIVGGGLFLMTGREQPSNSMIQLTDERIKEIEKSEQLLDIRNKEYDFYTDYLKKSLKLSLDSGEYYEKKMTYLVTSETGVDSNSIVALYQNELSKDEVLEKISVCLGNENEAMYVKEVVFFSQRENEEIEQKLQEKDTVFTIYIIWNNVEEIQNVEDILKSEVNQIDEELNEKGIKHKVKKVSDSLALEKAVTFIEHKYDILNKQKLLSEEIRSIKNSVSEEEWQSYRAISENVRISEPENVSYDLKKAVLIVMISAMAGFVAMTGIQCILYIISDKIHTPKEVGILGKMPVYGVRGNDSLEKRNSSFERTIIKKRLECNECMYDAENFYPVLQAMAEKTGKKVLYLFGSVMNHPKCLTELENIKKMLGVEGMELDCGTTVFESADKIMKAKKEGIVLLLEICEESKTKDVVAELQYLQNCEVHVSGIIAIKN